MTPHDIFLAARELGLQLEAADGKLAVIPGHRCPPDFAKLLLAHKAELLAWLTRQPCPGWQAVPPPDLPLNVTLPRPTPQNRERVVGYLLRQTHTRRCPVLAWLARRENAYYIGPGREWDCGLLAYAAARDAACWQLQRSEQDIWDLLRALGDVPSAS